MKTSRKLKSWLGIAFAAVALMGLSGSFNQAQAGCPPLGPMYHEDFDGNCYTACDPSQYTCPCWCD